MNSARKYENLTALELREMFLNGTIDADSMTIEDFEKLFDYETELDVAHMNGDVLKFCSDGLGRFEKYSQDDDIQPPPIEKALHKHYVRRCCEKQNQTDSEVSTLEEFHMENVSMPKRRRFLPLSRFGRIAAMFVAIIAVTLVIGHGVAVAMGYDNVLDLIRSAFSSDEKSAIADDGNHDMILTDGVRIYSSMSEMLEAENINILYPAELPEGYSFTDFRVTDIDGYFELNAYAEEPFIDFRVEFNSNVQIDDYKYEINGIKYNVFETFEGYQACWVQDGDYYKIGVSDESTLSEIIENLKES